MNATITPEVVDELARSLRVAKAALASVAANYRPTSEWATEHARAAAELAQAEALATGAKQALAKQTAAASSREKAEAAIAQDVAEAEAALTASGDQLRTATENLARAFIALAECVNAHNTNITAARRLLTDAGLQDRPGTDETLAASRTHATINGQTWGPANLETLNAWATGLTWSRTHGWNHRNSHSSLAGTIRQATWDPATAGLQSPDLDDIPEPVSPYAGIPSITDRFPPTPPSAKALRDHRPGTIRIEKSWDNPELRTETFEPCVPPTR